MRLAIFAVLLAVALPARAEIPRAVDKIVIKYQWMGLSGPVTWSRTLAAAGDPKFAGRANALVGALKNLHPADRVASCHGHTDDYPSFQITLSGKSGTIQLKSDSNCPAFAPWYVIERGHLSMQLDGTIGQAVIALVHDLDPKFFPQTAAKDDTSTFDYMTGEPPPPGTKGEFAAAAEVARFQASADFQKYLAGKKAEPLSAWCKFTLGKDCHEVNLTVTAKIEGDFHLQVHGNVAGEQVTVDALPDGVAAEVATFAASKLGLALAAEPSASKGPLLVDYKPTTCKQIPDTKPITAKPTDCHTYVIAPRGERGVARPYYVLYVPAAKMAWVQEAQPGNAQALLKALGATTLQLAQAERGLSIVELDGKVTISGP